MSEKKRIGLIVHGRVQGVGFRPFVWRLANDLSVTGFVKNTSAGVRIEIQGKESSLSDLEKGLENSLPPLAKITAIEREDLQIVPGESSFRIETSSGHAGQNVLVSPDIGICQDCLADIRSLSNFRHAYPFTNCVNCGPRYSITKKIPYDRAGTVMSCFELCENCAREYSDPSNRRFHAQPIACEKCGPAIWYVNRQDLENGTTGINSHNPINALQLAGEDILAGKIVALKGLGGFQLACDARNPAAIALLRQRKNRPHKALALMARDISSVRNFCAPGDAQIKLLNSPEKPIVLCSKKSSGFHPDPVAPDVPHIGVMLPYTPLHALLFDWLHEHGLPNPVLVMTSANPQGEPICLGNREALSRLNNYADSWLLHNRDILVRVDDSVTASSPVSSSGHLFFRRARGFVPTPQKLPRARRNPCVLGMGGDLKSAFCLTRSSEAFMSQHIGDLANLGTLAFYQEALAHMETLLECKPEIIVHDLHPDFFSSAIARDLAQKNNTPLIPLQHHAAHAASVLAENLHYSPALVLCLDGTGLGEDGNIWGGELIYMDLSRPYYTRSGSFTPFPLPGGEKAIQEPWRIALGMDFISGQLKCPGKRGQMIAELVTKEINCPRTSSCGRLFDAISARLGICETISYEGQAAMRLMNSAWPVLDNKFTTLDSPARSWLEEKNGMFLIRSQELFNACARFYDEGASQAEAAAFFHLILSDALCELALKASKKYNVRHIGLSGGVMQNILMINLLNEKLSSAGLQPLWHRELPPGDGGIALGQAVWGRQLYNSGKIIT